MPFVSGATISVSIVGTGLIVRFIVPHFVFVVILTLARVCLVKGKAFDVKN